MSTEHVHGEPYERGCDGCFDLLLGEYGEADLRLAASKNQVELLTLRFNKVVEFLRHSPAERPGRVQDALALLEQVPAVDWPHKHDWKPDPPDPGVRCACGATCPF